MRSAIMLGLRTLQREWRSGDLAVLFIALFVAVSALTGVGFLVDRIDRAVQLQANQVLGADLRLLSPGAISTRYDSEAAALGLKSARVTSMLSVVLKGDATQLTNVHAVSAGYPLRGKVQVASQPFATGTDTDDVPPKGEIWPDSRLMSTLQAQLGDMLTVGSAQLRATRVLVSRPDQGSGFADLASSLLMNEADLASTGLILPGSRAQYSALFAGESAKVAEFNSWLQREKAQGEYLTDIARASPEIGSASRRAGHFLSLAALAGVLLCAVAIAMTARRYVKRHLDLAALLKTMGAPQSTVLIVSIVQLACIAIVATAVGSVAGYLAHSGLLRVMRDMMGTELPAPGMRPMLVGLVAALLLLTGCALPSMLQLARVPAIRVLRRDIGPPPLGVILAYGPAVLAIGLLIVWVTGDPRLSAWFLLALALAVLAFALAGWLLVGIVGQLRGRAGISWRYGAANLARRKSESIVQIVALGLGLAALLLLTILRGDLIDDWRARLPADAPNYFFVNIPPDQRDALADFIRADKGRITRLLPMIRGRLVQINGVDVSVQARNASPNGSRNESRRNSGDNSRGDNFGRREQNLTWSADIGAGNRIVEGKWFTAEDYGKPLVSVATEYRAALCLKLGDKLTFDIAGESFTTSISSFREVQWDSMQPNFFLMFPPGLLEGAAGTWMGSAQYRPQDPATIAALVRRFPSISIFDMDQLLNQVRSIVDKAVIAVQSVFLFTLLAGVVVLLAAVQATRDERRYESAMLRTLGAARRTVLAGVLLEFALIGTLAGIVAAAAASTGAWLLATRVLEIPYTPDPLLWLAGAATGAGLVCVAGYLATRSALSQPPMSILRYG